MGHGKPPSISPNGPDRDGAFILCGRDKNEHVCDLTRNQTARCVTGVPTFVVGDRAVVGAQPYEALEKLVVEAGAELRH